MRNIRVLAATAVAVALGLASTATAAHAAPPAGGRFPFGPEATWPAEW